MRSEVHAPEYRHHVPADFAVDPHRSHDGHDLARYLLTLVDDHWAEHPHAIAARAPQRPVRRLWSRWSGWRRAFDRGFLVWTRLARRRAAGEQSAQVVSIEVREPQHRVRISAEAFAQLASAHLHAVDRNRVGDLDEPDISARRLRCQRHPARERDDVEALFDARAQRLLIVGRGLSGRAVH